MADGCVPVVLTPRPFAAAVCIDQPAGRTVRAMLVDAVKEGHLAAEDLSRAELYVDGERIDRDVALGHVLAEGQIINLVVEPMGGGGGGGGKNIGQILLQIAVIAVSAWVGGGGVALLGKGLMAKVAAASLAVGGNMALAAIFSPGAPSGGKANDRYALQSASNQYRPWAAQPLALGEVVVAPDLATKTYTESVGEDVWIKGVLGLHRGACAVSEMKIGDTLVSTLGQADFRMVQHLTPGPRTFSIVPFDVDQTDLTEQFEEGVPISRAVSQEGERFDFDIYFPGGLYWRDDKGRFKVEQNNIQMAYRRLSEQGAPIGGWVNLPQKTYRSSSNDPIRVTEQVTLPMGRYEFRLTKPLKQADEGEKRVDTMMWTALKAVAYRKPVVDETLSIIEFAVRATALNQGTLAPITCRLKPLCPTWTGSAWGPALATSNPAALVRWFLTGPAPAKPLLSIQADVGLRAWFALCEQYDWTAHIYLTDDRRQSDVLALLEHAGRASVFWDGSQIVASPWVEKPAPRQLFAGPNLKDHRWTIVYPEPVHALRVEFQNIDEGGEGDELFVYNDGYAAVANPGAGLQAATLVEALRLDGQKTSERAYRDGRWALGQRLHQRRVDSWAADVENVVCRYGDRVRLAWQRVGGEGGARVRTRRWTGGLVSGLRLDREVEFEPGEVYCVDVRLPDQLLTGVPVINPATTAVVSTREITFTAMRSGSLSPGRGDLIAFGVSENVSEDVEIIGIEPGDGLTANLTGLRYVAPLLMQGETGPIPQLQTRLSRDRAKSPPAPALLGVQIGAEGVRVGFAMPVWKGSPISGFTCRWRPKPQDGGTSGWNRLPALDAGAMILTTPPLREAPWEGDSTTTVEIEIVALTMSGQVSPALKVTAAQPVVDMPEGEVWEVVDLPAAADGSKQPGFLVTGTITGDRVARVSVAYGTAAEGPWVQEYDGPPVAGKVVATITGLSAGAAYWILATHWSAQGVSGGEILLGPRTAQSLVAGDFSASSPGFAALTASVSAAQADIDAAETALNSLNATIYTAGTGVLARSNAMFSSLNTPTTGVLARLTAVETSSSTGLSSATSRLNALEATVNAPGTGLMARTGSLETATANLQTGKADASRVTALETSINASGTGLLARVTSHDNAISNLQTGKADATRATALETSVNAAGTGLLARTGALETAASNLQSGKADASRATALETSVNAAGTGLLARTGALETATSNLQTGKAEASALNSLSATVTTANGNISALSGRMTTAEADIAGKAALTAFNTLAAEVATARGGNGALTTRFDQLYQLMIDADAGKASVSSVEALSVTVGNHTGSITTLQSVDATIQGQVNAKYGVVLNANGKATGFSNAINGATSSFDIQSDKFSLSPSSSSGARLTWVNGLITVFADNGVDVVKFGIQ